MPGKKRRPPTGGDEFFTPPASPPTTGPGTPVESPAAAPAVVQAIAMSPAAGPASPAAGPSPAASPLSSIGSQQIKPPGGATPEQLRVFALLKEIGQGHLFVDWPEDGSKMQEKVGLLDQASRLDNSYPGGLRAYVANAKRLLAESRDGVNAFAAYKPEVPEGINITFPSPEFRRLEKLGIAEVGHCAVVLVAGGLGERLGYSGIKVELPVQTVTGVSFIEYYLQNLKALAEESGAKSAIPLAIMTSDDTNRQTAKLLEDSNYFGYPKEAITIIKQEKVPSIQDNSGSFVLASPFELDTKPHGHGDVHSLLHSSGLAKRWVSEGRRWVAFIQDTNPMVFNALPATLGTSVEKGFEVNSICIPRKPKEAIGGIARLVGERPLTINVEYNQLEPLLLDATGKGDVADPKTGFSPYPGNINTLLFSLPQYAAVLERTQGQMPEFVNPKYKDAEKTSFKKPTRLECMMQDYPRLLAPEAKVGFTTFDRWFSFSPVKNNVADAKDKVKDGVPACASSGEADVYFMQCERLRAAGAQLPSEHKSEVYLGIPVHLYPRVWLSPSFAATQQQLQQRLRPGAVVSIAGEGAVILNGHIEIEHLNVSKGAVRVTVPEGASLVLRKCEVHNEGVEFKRLSDEELGKEKEQVRMRGYTTMWQGVLDIEVPSPGRWVYDSSREGEKLFREEQVPPAPPAPAPAAPAPAAPAPATPAPAAPAPAAAAPAPASAPPAPPQRGSEPQRGSASPRTPGVGGKSPSDPRESASPRSPPHVGGAKGGKPPSDPSLKMGAVAVGASALWFVMSGRGEEGGAAGAQEASQGGKAKL
eukprot:Hpha_TRINITY_DN13453_c0_g2::TRINITY_DN13453_c0_g2_i1::g.131071::m.131071/K12447/USP; UDP-sugar pyrophosphorylase